MKGNRAEEKRRSSGNIQAEASTKLGVHDISGEPAKLAKEHRKH